ncbi:hypothetical protein ACQP25_16990 [Microtetraspora malaysiensis]|uniref:hypothetical protein n=1 Tax=Microtetraspora malaysiensis TaxID=161358 RepID=UPI003D90A2E9
MTEGRCACGDDPCVCDPRGELVVVGEEIVGYQDELFPIDDQPTKTRSPLL